MARRFLTDINFEQNEAQNIVIHNLASAPSSPNIGQIYFNTGDERYYLRQTAGWKDVTGRIDDLLAGHAAISITDNTDGTLTINIAEATSGQAGLFAALDKVKLDGATSAATPDTLVLRDANGDVNFNQVNAATMTVTNAPVNGTDVVNKTYVDGLVSSGIDIQGGIDASANPNYPTADKGDAYYITVAGKIGGASGPLVEIGDLVIATAGNAGGDEAAVGSNWIILQNNVDAATEISRGIIRLATTAEVTAGVDDTTAVTPSKLAAYVAAQNAAGQFAANIGDGAATSYAIAHTLGSTDVQVQLHDTATNEQVEADHVITDANTVTVNFNVAPSNNAYRVVIQG